MELETLMQESVQHLEKDFYGKKFYFSYSSLSKLLWNPAVFYQMYVLGLKEERMESHLVQGKVVHALLLEEEKFNEDFIISPTNLPTGNPRTLVDRVWRQRPLGDERENLEDYQQTILDVMKEMNYHQSLKTDQQRLDKVFTNDVLNYWEFLKTKGDKTLVDQETVDFCKSAVELVKSNQELCTLIGCNVTEFDNKEVHNEVLLQVDINKRSFGLKGIIDNMVIDHDQKTIYVNDIKTTSKDLKDFPESVDFYNYWLQAVIYLTMVGVRYAHLIDQGYQLKFHFVVIDRTFQTYAFPVTEGTMSVWLEKLHEVLETADWHYTNKSFELPYQFAKGIVAL